MAGVGGHGEHVSQVLGGPRRLNVRDLAQHPAVGAAIEQRGPEPGGVEAVVSVLAISESAIPPTINLDNPDPDCDLDYVPHVKRPATITYALSNSFGFGGTNAALLFKRYDG